MIDILQITYRILVGNEKLEITNKKQKKLQNLK